LAHVCPIGAGSPGAHYRQRDGIGGLEAAPHVKDQRRILDRLEECGVLRTEKTEKRKAMALAIPPFFFGPSYQFGRKGPGEAIQRAAARATPADELDLVP
jgi:hypothetical protein